MSSVVRHSIPSDISEQPSGRVQARAEREAEVEARRVARIARGRAKEGGDARLHLAFADALQTLRDEHAVIAVELHDIGDGAERDQIEQAVQTRLGKVVAERAAPAQFRAQREQHVKHHADARNALAGELAARLIRIDDGARGRQLVAGQMVIGDEHVDAERVRRFHAVHARDAVIDGDQQFRLARRALRGQRDDLGREPIAVFKAVRHEVIDLAAEHAQPAHRDCAGGGAVAIVIGDDQHAALLLDGVGEQRGGLVATLERGGRHEAREAGFELVGQRTRRALA